MTDAELKVEALRLYREKGIVTTSLLQRELKVGYSRAKETINLLRAEGKVK